MRNRLRELLIALSSQQAALTWRVRMKKDCVSVIVPVYNGEKHLARCIESVLNQTYRNIELILVDNMSSDRSHEICAEYAGKDERVVVGRQERRWVSAARNRGLELCSGEYCCFIDQDDEYKPDMLETLYRMMQQEDVDLASCNYTKVRENGELKKDHRLVSGDYRTPDDSATLSYILDVILEVKTGFLVWNKMFRTELIQTYHITFEERLRIGEDLGFLINYACYARRTAATDEVLYLWYQYSTSASEFERSGSICLNDFTYALEHIYENIEGNGASGNKTAAVQKYYYIVFMKMMDYQYRKAVNEAAIPAHKDIVEKDFYYKHLKQAAFHPSALKKFLGADMGALLWKRAVYHLLKSRK